MRETMVVETRYVTSGEVFVAYQISGQDGPDLLMTPGFVSHLEQAWESPQRRALLQRLRLVLATDPVRQRGTGLSDRGVGVPHLDERIDDIRAVLDAAGSRSAFLFGVSEGGPMSILFAATYPGRVAGLILFGTYTRTVGASVPFDDFAALERDIGANWEPARACPVSPRRRPQFPGPFQRFAKFERLAASPSDVINLMRMNREIDVSAILPSIHVPTLVMHRRDDVRIRALAGRELGAKIPDARYIELPGNDHVPWTGDQDRLVEEIRQFMGFPLLSSRLIASSPLCCSPISSIRRYERRRWVTGSGVQLWKRIMRRCVQNCSGIAAVKSKPRATDSWLCSTGPRALSAAPKGSSARCGRSISKFGQASTPVRSR